jgi:hypothetical protein
MWGIVNSNYAGINSVLINPTGILHSKLYLDINIATADVFVENNALYIHQGDYKPFAFIRSDENLPKYGKDDLPFDYYRNSQRKDMHVSTLIMGPSFSISKRDYAIGFHTGFRSVVSVRDVPYEFVPFSFEGLNYTPQQNINYNDDNSLSTGMAWMEIGITYARTILRRGPHHLSAGLTAKAIMGYAGAYLNIDNIDYIVNNDSTINIRNINAELAYSNSSAENSNLINGYGYGFDIGFTYEKKKHIYSSHRSRKLCKEPYQDYFYRIGISFLDLGKVKFSSNAATQAYNDVGTFWEHADTINFRNIDQFSRMLSEVFYGNPDASLESNSMSLALPSAVSVQFDYHYRNQWYLNATAIFPVRMGAATIYRPAQLAVVPRYETPNMEFSMPISLYDYKYPRVGLSARFWFFTIGTDKILGFFDLTDFTGMDLYVSLKFNFLKGKCRNSGSQCDYLLNRSR